MKSSEAKTNLTDPSAPQKIDPANYEWPRPFLKTIPRVDTQLRRTRRMRPLRNTAAGSGSAPRRCPEVTQLSNGHKKPIWWLITMVSKSPNWGYSPSKWPFRGLEIGVTNYLLTGMILQVLGDVAKNAVERPER